jgi:hypothetical protein
MILITRAGTRFHRGRTIQEVASAGLCGMSDCVVPQQEAMASNYGKQHRPFMFTFLFDLHTPSLTLPSFYRSIHHQLGPLQKPLLSSTSPLNVSRRIYVADCDAGSQKRASSADNTIYDLVYDHGNLTVRSSIPTIPDPAVSASSLEYATMSLSDRSPLWSRVEALNVHSQILCTYTDTRSRPMELERTCKTSRGWWLVWVRIHDGVGAAGGDSNDRPPVPPHRPLKEAFLIRKASDVVPASARHGQSGSSGVRFLRDLSGASATSGSMTSPNGTGTESRKLAEGLGFDAQKYIESLLSLNR